MKKVGSWNIGVAAEAFAAGQFARYNYKVSVQYGADQPEYDLIANDGDKMLKISVKGSQTGSWGLIQKYIKNCDYHEAIDNWLNDHGKKTIFCLVQFNNISEDALPRMYLATPKEIAERLHNSKDGEGNSKLYENHIWGNNSAVPGWVDKIPDSWIFTKERAAELFSKLG